MTGDAPVLRGSAPGSPANAPVVIGATGGSGTRVLADVVRRAGVFVGTHLNPSNDALHLAGFLDRWVDAFALREDADPLARAQLLQAMATDLGAVLHRHRDGREPQGPWGWKEPRSMFVLPFLDRVLPSLRFVHVIRDGRDIAFSANQNQPRKHAEAVLGPPEPGAPPELRSIALWAVVNVEAARYGEEQLDTRYLRVRFEDLCREPAATISQLLRFLQLDADPDELAGAVAAPASLGRWREQEPVLLARLEEAAGDALERFGYDRPLRTASSGRAN